MYLPPEAARQRRAAAHTSVDTVCNNTPQHALLPPASAPTTQALVTHVNMRFRASGYPATHQRRSLQVQVLSVIWRLRQVKGRVFEPAALTSRS